MTIDKFSWPYTPKQKHPAVPLLKVMVINRANPIQQTEASFIVDSGSDYTIVGYDLISRLKLQKKGFELLSMGTVGNAPTDRETTKVYIEITELDFKLPLTAVMVEPENEAQKADSEAMRMINLNLLGRDFLNQINVILLGKESKFWIDVKRREKR